VTRIVNTKSRRRIVDATWQVLRRDPTQELQMADIAEAAGVDRSTLYWHFSDKAALVSALMETLAVEHRDYMRRRMGKAADAVAILEAWMLGNIEYWKKHSLDLLCILRLWGRKETVVPGVLFAQVLAPNQSVRDGVVAAVARALKEGRLAPCEPELIVNGARAIVDGAVLQMVAHGRPPEPLAELYLQHVVRPLRR
jgi:AcrR family transcriptional regulator